MNNETLKHVLSSLIKHNDSDTSTTRQMSLDNIIVNTTTALQLFSKTQVVPTTSFYLDSRGSNHLVQYSLPTRFQLKFPVQKGDLLFRELPMACAFIQTNLCRVSTINVPIIPSPNNDDDNKRGDDQKASSIIRHSEDDHAHCFASLLIHVVKQGMTADSLKTTCNFTENAVFSSTEEARVTSKFETLFKDHKMNTKNFKRLMAVVRYYCYAVYGYYKHSIVAMHLYRFASLLKHTYTSDANASIFFNEDGVVHVYAERDLKVGECLRLCFYGYYSTPLFTSWNLSPPVSSHRYISARDKPLKFASKGGGVNVATTTSVFENKSHRLVCRMIEHVNASCCVILNQSNVSFNQLLIDIVKHIRISIADASNKKPAVSKQYFEMFIEYLCYLFWIFDIERIYSTQDLKTVEAMFVQFFTVLNNMEHIEQSVSTKIRISLMYQTWFLIKRQLGMTASHPEFVDAYHASNAYCMFNEVNQRLLICDSLKAFVMTDEYSKAF